MALGTTSNVQQNTVYDSKIASVLNKNTKLINQIPDANVVQSKSKSVDWAVRSGADYAPTEHSEGADFGAGDFVGTTPATLNLVYLETPILLSDELRAFSDNSTAGELGVEIIEACKTHVKAMDRAGFKHASFGLITKVIANSTGSYAGIDLSQGGNSQHRATLAAMGTTSAAAAVTTKALEKFFEDTMEKNGTNDPNDYVAYCNQAVWQNIAALYPQTRFSGPVQEGAFGTGPSTLWVKGVQVISVDNTDGYHSSSTTAIEPPTNGSSIWLANVKNPVHGLKFRYGKYKSDKVDQVLVDNLPYGMQVISAGKVGHKVKAIVRSMYAFTSGNPGANGRMSSILTT